MKLITKIVALILGAMGVKNLIMTENFIGNLSKRKKVGLIQMLTE
jgi:hypothetical protein